MQYGFVDFYDLHAAFLCEVGNNYMKQASLRSQYITFSSKSAQVMKPIVNRRFHKIATLSLIRNQMNQFPTLSSYLFEILFI